VFEVVLCVSGFVLVMLMVYLCALFRSVFLVVVVFISRWFVVTDELFLFFGGCFVVFCLAFFLCVGVGWFCFLL